MTARHALIVSAIILSVTAGSAQLIGVGNCNPPLVRVCTGLTGCICVLPSAGAGNGDPILRDFAGRRFEFFGEPESYYNLYSDEAHQVNMGLFRGLVDGHDGTYMNQFGFAHNGLRVNITLFGDGDISVEAWQLSAPDEKRSVLVSGESSHMTLSEGKGNSLSIETHPTREWCGRTVEVTTGVVKLGVWSVPAGTVDSHNVSQPAYLNFNLTLSGSPAGNGADGVIGESLLEAASRQEDIFANSLDGVEAAKPTVVHLKGLTNDYRVSSMFGADFEFNRFGKSSTAVSRRSMLSSRAADFPRLTRPLTASSA